MPFSSAAKNLMLDELRSVALYLALHDDPPGDSGDNEVTGGSYARQACTWNSAASGESTLVANETFSVPAGTTVKHVGLWSASSAGTFYGYMDVTDEAFAGDGTYTVLAAGTKLDINDPA
jgi:hypothetical protein